jgi:hypothetical protein
MTKLKKNLFSTMPSVVKRGTVAMLCTVMMGLFLVVGCKKDNSATSGGNSGGKEGEVEEPEYPIDIPFTEYSLEGTSCQWINFDYHETVIIINSYEELGEFISCTEDTYPEIDFAKWTLLLAFGLTPSSPTKVVEKQLQQIANNEYLLSLDIRMSMFDLSGVWFVQIKVPKLSQDAIVMLNIDINPKI